MIPHLALVLLLAPEPGCALDLMSYNILGNAAKREATLALIERVDPDLLLLQEVTPRWQRQLETRLARRYPSRVYHARRGAYGFAFLSRFPVERATLVRARRGPPAAQCARLTLEAGPIAVCNLHLKSGRSAFTRGPGWTARWQANSALRRQQWDRIEAWMQRQGDLPRVAAGDTNTPGFDPLNRHIGARYGDALKTVGAASATFPTNRGPLAFPVLRLDYVWISPHLRAEAGEVLAGGGSDHHAVRVRLGCPR